MGTNRQAKVGSRPLQSPKASRLIVVGIVTSRRANLHDELMTLLGHDAALFPEPTALYATAYGPAHRDERNEIDLASANGAPSAELQTKVDAVKTA